MVNAIDVVQKWHGERTLIEAVKFVEAVVQHSIDGEKQISFAQVGAMDGHSLDPIFKHACEGKWRGVAIEALHSLCLEAQETYASHHMDVECIEATVGAVTGAQKLLHFVDPETILHKNLPLWLRGIATLEPERNALRVSSKVGKKAFDSYCNHVRSTVVTTTRFDDIMKSQASITRIDVLSINVQGLEKTVIEQVDFQRWRPLLVVAEHQHLSAAERTWVCERLRHNGYAIRVERTRLHALDYRVIWLYWEDVPGRLPRSSCLELCEKTMIVQRGTSRIVKVTPKNLTTFISEGLPVFLDTLHVAERADYIRVRLVTQYGGVWCDTDTIFLRSFDVVWQLLERERPQLATWSEERVVERTQLSNGFFGALANSFFLRTVLKRLIKMCNERKENQPWGAYGGKLFNQVVRDLAAYNDMLMLCEHELVVDSKPVFRQNLAHTARKALPFSVDDKNGIVVPLYHTLDNMRNVDAENVNEQDTILKEWLLRGLQNFVSCVEQQVNF